MRTRKNGRRMTIVVLLLFALALLLPFQSSAAEHREGETVIIGVDEVIGDDLIITATKIIVNGRIKGDLIALGQTIEINGIVDGDLMAAGSSVIVAGEIRDDVRIGAQTILFTERGRIGDDLLAGAMSLETRPGSSITGSLLYGGAQALLAGDINEHAQVATEGLEIAGRIGGNLEATVGNSATGRVGITNNNTSVAAPAIAAGLTVRDSASIGGRLDYTSRNTGRIPEGTVVGPVAYHQPAEANRVAVPENRALTIAADLARSMVTLLLIGMLLLWLAPRWPNQVSEELERKPLASLLSGILSIAAVITLFIVLVIATVLLATMFGIVTLNGLMGLVIAVGILAFLALIILTIIAVAYIAQIAVSYEIGRLIVSRTRPNWLERPIVPLAIGIVLLVLAMALPWVGGLIGLAAILGGLGALWLLGRDTLAHQKTTTTATPA